MIGFLVLVLLGAALLLLVPATTVSAIRRRGLPPLPLLGALGGTAVLYLIVHVVA